MKFLKKNLFSAGLAIACFGAALSMLFVSGCGEQPEETYEPVDLVIPINQITADANFFGLEVNGLYMEVIAFQYGDEYRTAFNTCQVCNGSRKAYFEPDGNELVCQNCKFRFELSEVGIETEGYSCHPVPVPEGGRTVTEDSITIPYETLVDYVSWFKYWKEN